MRLLIVFVEEHTTILHIYEATEAKPQYLKFINNTYKLYKDNESTSVIWSASVI